MKLAGQVIRVGLAVKAVDLDLSDVANSEVGVQPLLEVDLVLAGRHNQRHLQHGTHRKMQLDGCLWVAINPQQGIVLGVHLEYQVRRPTIGDLRRHQTPRR